MKRNGISSLVATLVVIIIVLIGASGYLYLYPSGSSSATKTVTTTVSGTASASAIGALKVAMIVPITKADHSWNYQAEAELGKLQSEYGFNLQITENKFDGSSAQPVAEQYASSGVNVVFLQGIQYQVMASTIAPKYPNTLFVCVDCLASNYSNVYRIWLDTSGGGFVLGAMAGMVTHSDKLGLIGGGRVPSIWNGHEGFKAGVLYTSTGSVTFTEKYEAFSWADSAGAKTDATNMYTNGADIVFSSGDGIDVGVIGAALSQPTSPQVWASNVYSNLTAVDPTVNKVLLGSMVVNWAVLYNKALIDFVTHSYSFGFVTADMQSGILTVQPGPNLPDNVKKAGVYLEHLITLGAIQMYFKTNPATGNPFCFDKSSDPTCADTALTNTSAQFNYLPPASSLP